ncbi:MAG: hypothetical protein N0E58_15860 [Candidatus Thiodiazotropha endolucinida]|uniref:Uncharacterized protein n=1 Tax=Candidatus Thiodiazotropha taylori TaxID=2792791 RepID=A0A9E4NML7_9GAMM|nr:hypothetical protein [Candidatus Thiodiazotropha taylori]MCW4237723.1 hypothetical protein [Candidatus Thiodiazotropha endolucinida]
MTGLVANESGGFLDDFWGWAGERVTYGTDQYIDHWLDERFPERVAPPNSDFLPAAAAIEEEATSGSGFFQDPGNQQMLVYVGLGLLALAVLK